MPNLLLDQTVMWESDVSITPRLNSTPRGYQHFQFSDVSVIRALNLPVITAADYQHILQLATGPYIILRSNITLTATREYELRELRARGGTGSITNYNTMASTLPQTTPVYFFQQTDRPSGYSEQTYGPWLTGNTTVLKCQIASTHKSPGTRSNLHTVTLVVAATEPEESPLLLTGPLMRLISYYCTCGSGAGELPIGFLKIVDTTTFKGLGQQIYYKLMK